MKSELSATYRVSLATLVAVALAVPAAAGQRTQGAVVSGGSDSGGTVSTGDSGGGRSAGGDSGGGRVSGGGGATVARPSGGGPATVSTPGRNGGTVVPRPREDRDPVGQAIPRPSTPGPRNGTVILNGGSYYGGYYPWGYGGLGLGGYYGWYDPWWYDPSYYGYGYGRYSTGYEGRLRLKVQPSEAEVFVDGYYAGIVDEFDNMFQHLSIETGPHRIEVRQDGYEPLTFEVRILPDRTVTYRGEMKRIP